ncbi:MAG: 2OG-Fe(II) oxygenase [Candidatus Binatia bacterium]
MTYLDFDRLAAISADAFRSQKPYPWINPEGLLTTIGYRRLLETLPDVSRFKPFFGKKRSHGQKSHDRYYLDYSDDLDVASPWKEFIAELRGKKYQGFLRRMLRVDSLDVGFHWHYTPNGCSVSPHCDAKRKLGSHIFYFNTTEDWDPAWGGETLVLDDGGRFKRASAPEFDDFQQVISTQALGNRSVLFARTQQSWHGVREIHCPQDRLRKVFIVVINRFRPIDRLLRAVGLQHQRY